VALFSLDLPSRFILPGAFSLSLRILRREVFRALPGINILRDFLFFSSGVGFFPGLGKSRGLHLILPPYGLLYALNLLPCPYEFFSRRQ